MPTRSALSESDARKQARKERAFYGNLASFVLVMSFLTAINLLTSPDSLWVVWPFLGWGIGIGSQAISTFGHVRRADWIERRAAELMGETTSDERIRTLLDEELDARVLPAGAPQDLGRLQRRIEHLEAIVTATDDPADPGARLTLDFDAPTSGPAAAARRRDRA
ncbi:2TM domain-containing protein [Rubrivirga sp. IMCC45206]|uniref:2TM domain-containing protein n=1 Tax=Rubrivirga sp. IMCC45206 TaxID=3391614 RepID=UPI003990058D